MKKLIISIALLIPSIVFGQSVQIDSIKWISKNLGYMSFYKDELSFNFDGYQLFKRFKISADTLIMVDSYTTSADNFSKRHVDLFKFLYKASNDKKITIIPFDDNAKTLVSKSSYEFQNLKYCVDPNFKFKRLAFSAGWCLGTCPVMKVSINNIGEYYFEGDENTQLFKGNYKGRLTTVQLERLNYLLQHSELEKMLTWKQGNAVMDAPNYQLQIGYNNKQQVTIQTNEPPLNMVDLISFLLNSYKTVSLEHDSEKRSFN